MLSGVDDLFCASYTWGRAFLSRHWGSKARRRVRHVHTEGLRRPPLSRGRASSGWAWLRRGDQDGLPSVSWAPCLLRIQNSRSHIPLCLQFLYTTEGNKGTTVIWLQHHGAPRWREAVVARVAFSTLELCKLLLGKKIDFYTYWESNLFSFDCKHERVLFYAFYSFSTVCTGALLNLRSLRCTRGRPPGTHRARPSHARNDTSRHSFLVKKSKKKSLWNFVFLVLSSPMTLLYNCGGRGELEAHLDR